MRVIAGVILSVISIIATNGFTDRERILIGENKESVFRLYTVNNTQDSLLLRKKSAPLRKKEFDSPYYEVLKNRMLATVKNPENEGVGIAAPQIGINRQLIAVQRFDKTGEPFEFYTNPRITYRSKVKSIGSEGCLSLPEERGEVMRSDTIKIKYDILKNKKTETVEEIITGFTAVIFQHEIDHLNGILFVDRSESNNLK